MRLILPLLLLTTLLATSACETMEGLGRDMSTAGDAVTAEAQDAGY
jgi:predicted small secreted protein